MEATDKGMDVFKIVEVMKTNGVEVTKEVILDVCKIVYNYQDNASMVSSITPMFSSLLAGQACGEGEKCTD